VSERTAASFRLSTSYSQNVWTVWLHEAWRNEKASWQCIPAGRTSPARDLISQSLTSPHKVFARIVTVTAPALAHSCRVPSSLSVPVILALSYRACVVTAFQQSVGDEQIVFRIIRFKGIILQSSTDTQIASVHDQLSQITCKSWHACTSAQPCRAWRSKARALCQLQCCGRKASRSWPSVS